MADDSESEVAESAAPVPAEFPVKRERRRATKAERVSANVPIAQRGLSLYIGEAPKELQASLRLVATEAVHEDESQQRVYFDPDGLEGLAASIRADGILDPLKVRPRGEGGYLVVDGARRLRAARMLGLATVPVIVRQDLTKEDVRAASVASNVQRAAQTPWEDARGYHSILEANPGLTQEGLAARMGVSVSTIQARLHYLEVPAELGAILGDGKHEGSCLDVVRAVLTGELDTAWYEKLYVVLVELAKEELAEKGRDNAEVLRFRSSSELLQDFLEEISSKYGAFDPTEWRYEKYLKRAAWKRAIEESVTVTLPANRHYKARTIALEKAPFEVAMKEIEAAFAEEEAAVKRKDGGKLSDAERESRKETAHRRAVDMRRNEIMRENLSKGVASITEPQERLLDLLVLLVSRHVVYDTRAADHIADLTGLDVRQVLEAGEERKPWDAGEKGIDMATLLKKAKKKGDAVYWNLVAASVGHYLAPHDDGVYKLLTGSTMERVNALAEKEVTAIEKQRTEGTLPKVKSTEDARSVPCPTCAKPDEKKSGGIVGKWCVSPSARQTRTFHVSRLKAWSAKPLRPTEVKPAAKRVKSAADEDDDSEE